MDGGCHGADLFAGSVLTLLQGTGWKTISRVAGGLAGEDRSTRSHCISRPFATWILPTTGTLFSLWQATMHALHPMHAFRSIVIPH